MFLIKYSYNEELAGNVIFSFCLSLERFLLTELGAIFNSFASVLVSNPKRYKHQY